MTVAQQDPEVLYRLMDFLDIKQAITFGSGGCYYLQICRKALVKRIIDGVYPFIIVKKVDIDKMLAEHWPADKRGV